VRLVYFPLWDVFDVFDDPAVEVVDGVDSELDVVPTVCVVLLEDEALETWNGAKRMGGKDMVMFELFLADNSSIVRAESIGNLRLRWSDC
jgi:hypothetical protein